MTDRRPDAPDSTRSVWDSFSGRLRSWFTRRVPVDVDPEELLQESFLRIHTGLPSLADEERLASWVYRIAGNVYIDAMRARSVWSEESPEADHAADEGESAPGEEVAAWLEGFLDELSDEDRDVLRMADFAELPQATVARQLGFSLTAAKSRIQRARKRLRSRLLACCELEFGARGEIVDWRNRRSGTDCCDDK